ncbi:predicted protein [Lichtheimia corymbifera JMRC:FSU:9682]|uniref:Uncharacterized protein n=1 Tax=Lichtheimia corymbifera JMRC:FSU:9682 TaxID=1263082 RepID=A0A068S4A3_9FUNG|nr:predicted protein [Lichtheimia corymbifera JMRC:FSU:9682]
MTPFYNANVNTRGMLVISTEPSLSLVNEQRRLGLLQQPSSLYPFPSDVEVYMQAVEACPIDGQKDAQGNVYVELWVVKKQQPQLISSSEIQSAIVAEQLNRRGAWNKTISVPLPNFGDNRKVFVKVIEKDIAELQHQALYKQQQQPLAHVHLQQQSQQQQQQLSQQHFQQQQQLNQHQFQQQQQLNQQQFQQQQCQQECQQQQQQQCQQGQRVFGQNLMDNVHVNLFDNMSPLQQQMSGNTYFKLLDTSNLTVDGNIYVKVPQSELLCTPSAGMIPTISHAPAFFKVLDPSMITSKSGITQNQVFFKVFDSDPNANKIYVHSPLKQQQRGEKAH